MSLLHFAYFPKFSYCVAQIGFAKVVPPVTYCTVNKSLIMAHAHCNAV